MKKTLTTLAIAAGMAASSAAFAAPTVYGVLHASLDSGDTGGNTDSISMESNTSAIGIKGSEDLGDGMKAFYKVEFQIDLSERNKAMTDRDMYIGLKGGMGSVKLGSFSNNYKQKGGKIDPMYRTALEGRNDSGKGMQMQSPLHKGAGRLNGRMTDAVQWSSPKMGGMQLVINTTFDAADTSGDTGAANVTDIDETIGVGFRYVAKSFGVHIDMIDMSDEGVVGGVGTDIVGSESATKIGGYYKMGAIKVGLQLEQTEDLLGSDYTFLSVDYKLDKNNAVALTVGQRGEDIYSVDADDSSSSFAMMYTHKMSKKTNVYVGYGDRSDDKANSEGYSVMTAGMRVKF